MVPTDTLSSLRENEILGLKDCLGRQEDRSSVWSQTYYYNGRGPTFLWDLFPYWCNQVTLIKRSVIGENNMRIRVRSLPLKIFITKEVRIVYFCIVNSKKERKKVHDNLSLIDDLFFPSWK